MPPGDRCRAGRGRREVPRARPPPAWPAWLLAPGIQLIEVRAERRTPGRAARRRRAVQGALGHADRHHASAPTGCTDCVSACNTENGLSGRTAPTDAQWIRKIEIKEIKTGRTLSLPMMCQHCAEPPCVDVCPTGASFKRADGIVLVDRHTCIGCRYCVMACPYKARSFVHEPLTDQKPDVPRGKGCVEGCTLCVHRVDKGDKAPACVEACTEAGHDAIALRRPERPGQRDLAPRARPGDHAGARRPAARHRRALPGAVTMKLPSHFQRTRGSAGLLRAAGALGGLVTADRPGCRALHGDHGHIVTGMNNQVVWGMPHVFAMFMIVAASGALNVASIGSVFGQAGLQAARAAVRPAVAWRCWPAA